MTGGPRTTIGPESPQVQALARRRSSIALKIATAIVLTSTPLAWVLTILHARSQSAILEEALAAKAQLLEERTRLEASSLARNLARSLEEAVAGLDFYFVDQSIENVLRTNPEVKAAGLLDAERRALKHTDRARERQVVPPLGPGTQRHGDVQLLVSHGAGGERALLVEAPVEGGERGKAFGTLRLSVSLGRVDRDVAQAREDTAERTRALWRTAVLGTVVATLFAVAIALALSSRISQPLRELTRRAQAIAEGDLDVSIVPRTRDEIGDLTVRFDQMRLAIREKILALGELNRTLEQKVLERTAELEAANLQLRTARDALFSEMELAAALQTALLPAKPYLPGLDVAAAMFPAAHVGGDYYDVLDHRRAGSWVAIGDVSGHGVTPGVLMMMAHTTLRALLEARADIRPHEVVQLLNVVLANNVHQLRKNLYMTLAVLRFEGGTFTAAGAHLDFLVRRAATGKVERIRTEGTYIGVLDALSEAEVPETRFELRPGDTLVLFTDGVTEARAEGGEMFGTARLVEVIEACPSPAAEPVRDAIASAVQRWTKAQEDDYSVVVLSRPA